MQQPPTLIPTPKPNYMLPHRPFAIEAMIAAVCMTYVNGNPVPYTYLAHMVERALPWAPRIEIHTALQRMVKAGRVVPQPMSNRAIPLYALPNAIPTPPSPTS